MKTPVKKAFAVSILFVFFMVVCAVLTGCATQPDMIYTPTEVDKPVQVLCKPPVIVRPDDMLAALRVPTTLTEGMKTALAQHDYDLGYEGQLEAAITACQ